MTEEFLKSMANEYSKEPSECLLASLCCGSDLPDDENTLEEVKEPINQAYIDGYKKGLQEIENHLTDDKINISLSDAYLNLQLKFNCLERRNEELFKAYNQFQKDNEMLFKRVDELNDKVSDLEEEIERRKKSYNDLFVQFNILCGAKEELKEQIEKMKCCENCKHNGFNNGEYNDNDNATTCNCINLSKWELAK